MRCALIHDWLTGIRGGERILELLCELLPQSEVHTLIHSRGSAVPGIGDRAVSTSWLNRFPGVRHYYRCLLPLMPFAARSLEVRGYDLVVATSHCVAHGAEVQECGRFVCCCFTPMRYAWDTQDAYFAGRKRLGIKRLAVKAISGQLRKWDYEAAQRVGEYVAISQTVQERIRRCYGRESTIIYPPVDTETYQPVKKDGMGDFYLWVGALAPYKRIDLALEAFGTLDRRLVVIGDGQDARWAKKRAPENVTFLGRQPDEVLREHYSNCRALIFPGEEDFGIVPLEAQACGRPVIAYGKGGALETIVGTDGSTEGQSPTGVFFGEPDAECLAEAVRRFEGIEADLDPVRIRENACRFSREKCTAEWKRHLFGDHEETVE